MSDRVYTPDVWVVVEFTGTEVPETYRRVLAGWYGGFAGSNSWKMSSGIVETIDHGDYIDFINESGSVYRCGKGLERYSMLTQSVFASYACQNDDRISVQRVDYGCGSTVKLDE